MRLIVAFVKLLSLFILLACFYYGYEKGLEYLETVMRMPERFAMATEIKQIDRLIQGQLAMSGHPVRIVMRPFCEQNLVKKVGEPWQDRWGSPYRLFMKRKLYHEDAAASLSSSDVGAYIVVSAGPDAFFLTPDDLVSRGLQSQPAHAYSRLVSKQRGRDPARQPYNQDRKRRR